MIDTTDRYLRRLVEQADEKWKPEFAATELLEKEYSLPVIVKYGDAAECRKIYGVDGSDVWEAVPDSNEYLLFRIESDGDLYPDEANTIRRTMSALGAWSIGRAGTSHEPNTPHDMYVWPKDHPVTEMI